MSRTEPLLDPADPLAVEVTEAIQTGDVATLNRLLAEHPGLATARIGQAEGRGMNRTLLHIVTDWPGHPPNGVAIVQALVAAGADVNARFVGTHAETPLHWAASCDDVDVLDALLDAGADIEAPGAVIGRGTPLADARAFGQWRAARRLLERGARTTLHDAATLGLTDRLDEIFVSDEPPGPDEVTSAFWCACHGGQQRAAEFLLARGADLNWVGWDHLTPLDAAVRSEAPELADWLRARGARSAT